MQSETEHPVQQLDEALSLMSRTLDPVVPPDSAREQLLAQLRGRERYVPFAGEVARTFALSHDDACEALRAMQDPSAWLPGATPGSYALRTPALAAAHALIVKLPAGTRVDAHTHSHRERTFVLDGALREAGESGERVHTSGALMEKPAGSRHALTVEGDDCVVIFAPI